MIACIFSYSVRDWTVVSEVEISFSSEEFRARLLEESEQTHREEVAQLQRDFEAKLKELEARQVETQSRFLKDRLMRLSQMASQSRSRPERKQE